MVDSKDERVEIFLEGQLSNNVNGVQDVFIRASVDHSLSLSSHARLILSD